jgi:hypothetical protein
MNVVRWLLQEVETGDSYTVEFNPNKASSYRGARSFDFTRGVGGRVRSFKSQDGPVPWTWGGVIQSKAHHDALEAWGKKKGKVRVTDHLGRTFEVMMKGARISDRRQTGANAWRFTYEMDCLLLRRIA